MSMKLSSALRSSANEWAHSARVLLAIVHPAEQVVDPPLRRLFAAGDGRLGVERIALEVEEQVAVIGPRQRHQRFGRHHLVCRHGRRLAERPMRVGRRRVQRRRAGRTLELQARLGSQQGERVGVHPGGRRRRGERVDRQDAGRPQSITLHRTHPGHQKKVSCGDDLGIACRAPAAGHHPQLATRVAPCDRLARRAEVEPPVGDEGRQPLPPEREHRHEIVGGVHAHAAVTEQQLDAIGALDTEPVELVDIGGELHQCGDAGMAGELGVLHDPAAELVADQEVGEADELGSREGRLIDHVGVGRQSGVRRRHRCGQGCGIR